MVNKLDGEERKGGRGRKEWRGRWRVDVIKMHTILPENNLCLSSVPLYYICGKIIYDEIDLYYTCKGCDTYSMAYSRLNAME